MGSKWWKSTLAHSNMSVRVCHIRGDFKYVLFLSLGNGPIWKMSVCLNWVENTSTIIQRLDHTYYERDCFLLLVSFESFARKGQARGDNSDGNL